jgi:hypothetical protein
VIRGRMMLAALAATTAAAVVSAPVAHADQSVTYEVVSDRVSTVDLDYFDGATRKQVKDVALPWRTTVSIANPGVKARLAADWRRDKTALWKPGDRVTVRLYIDGTPGCEVTVDIGTAICNGRLAPFGPNTIIGASARDRDDDTRPVQAVNLVNPMGNRS